MIMIQNLKENQRPVREHFGEQKNIRINCLFSCVLKRITWLQCFNNKICATFCLKMECQTSDLTHVCWAAQSILFRIEVPF